MQWFTQELFLEILLLPTAILAFAHSSLFAYELLQSKSAVPPKHATAWQRLIVWHTILPLAGIICAAYMLTTKEDEWGVFGSTDPAEVLLILICSLAAGLGKSTHNRLTIGRVPILWRVVGFHMIATTAPILSSVLMSFVFAGHFAIEVSAANQFTTGSPAGTPWQDRQNAWITILWIAIPPMIMSVCVWTTIIAQRRIPARLFHCCGTLLIASISSFALTYTVQAWPIPVLSKDLPAGVTMFPMRLLIAGGPLLLFSSGIIAQRISLAPVTLDLPATQVSRARRAVLVLTCVVALVTVNWIPIVRSMAWPPPWSNRSWLRAAAQLRAPEHVPMNLLYLALLVAIVLAAFRFLTNTGTSNIITVPHVDVRSMLLRVPPIFASIVLTVLSLFWLATGVWGFLTVFT